MCVTRRDSNNVALLFEKGYCIAQWAKSLKKKILQKNIIVIIFVCVIFLFYLFLANCALQKWGILRVMRGGRGFGLSNNRNRE